MTYLWAAAIILLNTLGLILVPLGLPGTWLMVAVSAGASWASGSWIISVPVLCVLVGLALAGEVVEFATGAIGALRAGSTWRGSVGALAAGGVGAFVGTFAIPVPVVGSVLGACAGAFLGGLAGELWGGKNLERSLDVGKSAFLGRFLGTLTKLGVGIVIWCIAAAAAMF
jgi:hypothetical protein